MAAESAAYLPKWPGIPPSPTSSMWSETQWTILLAIMDAVIPSVVPESGAADPWRQAALPAVEYEAMFRETRAQLVVAPGEDLLRAYLEDCPSASEGFVRSMRRVVSSLPVRLQKDLGGAMALLNTRLGSLLLTGSTTPMHTRPVLVREGILQSWRTALLPQARLLAKSLTVLGKNIWVQTSDPFLRVADYADTPPDLKPGADFDYHFVQLEPGEAPAVLETDVVVVGSGCGGAVAAKVLAEAGHRVLVVDKGYYFPPSELPMPTAEGLYHLYEGRGIVSSADTSTSLLAGSCWGGGGTVNWSTALQTQGFVRREWAEEHGLPLFASHEFQTCLDRVCDFMGVGTAGIRQNHRGQVLLEGARRLGWDARAAPQSTGGHEHSCGHCHLGCGSGEKQGPAVSWLPAAARAGARFVEGLRVERVTFSSEEEETDATPGTTGKLQVATGVVGRWTSRDKGGGLGGPVDKRVQRDVVVKAKRVVMASGSLWSPILLLNSGLKVRFHPPLPKPTNQPKSKTPRLTKDTQTQRPCRTPTSASTSTSTPATWWPPSTTATSDPGKVAS
jgi:hypothetical protein